MNPTASATELPYYDRSTALIVFGILTIGLGCLAGLLCLVMLAECLLPQLGVSTHAATIVPAFLVYACASVMMIWLGIGSILAKRWARNLLLIFSWSWLVIGVFAMVLLAVVLPRIMLNLHAASGQQETSNANFYTGFYVGMLIAFCFYGFIFIVLPVIWTAFYSSRHVKGTCEWRDPHPDWTEACPLPVLGFCLWTLFSAVSALIMGLAGHGVAPFFGFFVTGLASRAFYVGLAAAWFLTAGLVYRLDARGWWLALATSTAFLLSSLITYFSRDILEMYQLMGYGPEDIENLRKSGMFEGHAMGWITGFSILPFLGYLFFIRRYFVR